MRGADVREFADVRGTNVLYMDGSAHARGGICPGGIANALPLNAGRCDIHCRVGLGHRDKGSRGRSAVYRTVGSDTLEDVQCHNVGRG